MTLFNNFAVEVAGLEGRHVGVIQSVREIHETSQPWCFRRWEGFYGWWTTGFRSRPARSSPW